MRSVPAGAVVGYNGTFVATEPMRLALVAAGYGDGLDRRLGNRFSLLVRGQRAPLVGRISMDQAVLDVTEIPGVEAGDEVVLLGKQGGETISACDQARGGGDDSVGNFYADQGAGAAASSRYLARRVFSPRPALSPAAPCDGGDHRLGSDARVEQHVVKSARAPVLLVELA